MKKIILLATITLCLYATTFAQDTTMHKSHHKTTHQMFTCTMHPEVMKNKPGKCPKCNMTLVKAKEIYACPMHANMMRSNAGKCPKCGMDMTKKGKMKGMKM